MILHNNNTLFQDAITATARRMNISTIYIEKDYWITYALHTIYNDPIGDETIFKGGTALSKCFNLIQRFSEDIDLVVLRREGETNNQLTTKIKRISKIVTEVLPEIEMPDITQKRGMNRKTAHAYKKVFEGSFGQIRDIIVVEASWLGNYEPYTRRPVSSYIFDIMKEAGQLDLAAEYGLLPFEVKVLEPKRTFCEKIMSLVRFSYTENPMVDLKNKIRHTYDIHLLLQNDEIRMFFYTSGFDELLLKVANDDVLSFKNNNEWLKHHPRESIFFADTEKVWAKLKETYGGNFRDLVFGSFPEEGSILKSLLLVADRLRNIEWIIKF